MLADIGREVTVLCVLTATRYMPPIGFDPAIALRIKSAGGVRRRCDYQEDCDGELLHYERTGSDERKRRQRGNQKRDIES